jgi:Cu2+-exporting ATPase
LLDGAAKTQTIIRQNLYWALIYNALAIPLAAMGLIAPWLAAVGMSLSSLLVTVNALRLNALALQKTRTPAVVARQANTEQLGGR